MTEDEAYKVHIQYTFNAFCKIVIRHAAIDKILNLRRRWEREVSLDYLMNAVSYTHLKGRPQRAASPVLSVLCTEKPDRGSLRQS